MKNLSYLLIAGIISIATACPRLDNIEELNSSPRMVFNGKEPAIMVMDSIKISLKNSQVSYDLGIQLIDDNNNLLSLKYEQVTGEGILFQDSNPVEGSMIHLDLDLVLNLSYEPHGTGTHALVFSLTDVFDETATTTLELVAFDNLLPVALLSITEPETQSDPFEYVLDASGSFDRDKKFGGRIMGFEYTFLGKIIVVDDNSLPVIFPGPGNYEISVRVMDNDNQFSESATITAKIE